MNILIGIGVVAAFLLCWLAMPIGAGLLVFAHQRIVARRKARRRVKLLRLYYGYPWNGGAR
jgi:hypothetical protein